MRVYTLPVATQALSAIGDVVGTVSKGLPAELIAKLPVQTAAELRALSDENNDCAVCRMEYDDGDMLTTLLPCKHTYHSECIGQWLTLNKVCLLFVCVGGCGGGNRPYDFGCPHQIWLLCRTHTGVPHVQHRSDTAQ